MVKTEANKAAEANVEKKDESQAEESTELATKEFEILDGIKLARENSKKRKFEQSWDFVISLKGVDLKKPENRFNAELPLPKSRGKEPKIAIFADLTAKDAKEVADLVITKNEIESLAKNKKKMKRIANDYDFFFGEAPLMPMIGKSLGVVLGPRGKVPKPLPPKGNIAPIVNASKRMIRVTLKETPVIYATVGSEKMADEDIAENAKAVYKFVTEKLPKGKNNIRSVFLKLTMGKPIKLSMK